MSKIIRANGININYKLEGPEGAPVLMLSHSLASNLQMWDAQVESLATNYKILRADTRGHGKTEVTDSPYTVQLLLEDAIALLDALQIDKVHFCGLSLGGMIGQRFGAFYGDRLFSLTLCDTTSQMRDPTIWSERIKAAQENGMPGIKSKTLSRWFTHDFIATENSIINEVGEMIDNTPIVGYLGCCEAIKKMDHTSILSRIQTPTLIIVGEQDQSTPVAAAEFLKENIKKSKLMIIKSASHLSNIEQYANFNAVLEAHINANN